MKRILIISDDQELFDLLCDLLQGEGYEVIFSPYEDMRVVERILPDLIFLDFLSGAMQSKRWALLQKLKLSRSTAAIPVVVSAAAEKSVQEQQSYLASKGVTVVLKPFTIEDLLQTVGKVFQVNTNITLHTQHEKGEQDGHVDISSN